MILFSASRFYVCGCPSATSPAKIFLLAIMFNWFGLKLNDICPDLRTIRPNKEMFIWSNLSWV
jgi:hypothetical protein